MTGEPIFIHAVELAVNRFKLKPYLFGGKPVKTFTAYKFEFKESEKTVTAQMPDGSNKLSQRPLTKHECDEPAILVKGRDAKYPPASRAMGHEGDVFFSITIDEKGYVWDIDIFEDTTRGDSIRDAVIQAVKLWRFKPAVHNGKAVPSIMNYRMSFRLGPSRPKRLIMSSLTVEDAK